MRVVWIVILGFVVIAGGAAAAPTFKMSQAELKEYCDAKEGNFVTSVDRQGYSCVIGTGKTAVVIGCGPQGICKMYNEVVFAKPQPARGNVIGRPAVISSENAVVTTGVAQGASAVKQLGSTAATASTTMTVTPTKQVGSNAATGASPTRGSASMSSGRATLRQP